MTLYEIDALESGECRWIGRHDVHVYCQHPFVETMMPTGRSGWTRPAGTARYCVVCPEAGLEYGDWLPLEQAAAIVDSLVAGGVEKLFPAA